MSTLRISDRRQGSERRQSSDRRRQSDGRYGVFEVCRSTLHLALVVRGGSGDDGADRVVTRSLQWRREATSLHTERGVVELTAAFETLVSEERLAGAKIRIALGGEFCVTRVITGPSDEVRREFAELEERSLRYLTLGPGRKALASNIQQIDARHQYAVLAVASQRTLDLLMQIADSVGVQIESIEPSLIALSRAQAQLRAASQDACLIIQLDEDVAELGICHRGRLLLDYRPGGRTNADNVADAVAQHMSRLQRYLERYHSYLTAPLRNIYLAGETDAVARAREKFAKLKGFETHILEPGDFDVNWQHAGDTPRTDLAATLGAALGVHEGRPEEQGPNLIASTLAQLRAPMRPILIRSLAPLAAVLLVAVALLTLRLAQRRETSGLRAELESLTPVCAQATELRLKLIASERKLAELQTLAKKLHQPDWQQILNHIGQSMPDDVWLDRVSVQDGRSAAIGGSSYSDNGVYDFVEYLKLVPEIAEIALEGTGAGQGPTGPITNFSLQLTLASLSGHSGREVQHD
jgi:hypothetical protein